MNIEIVKVPQYMSKNVNVIMVDGKPFCTCRGKETTSKVIARLDILRCTKRNLDEYFEDLDRK